MTLINNIKSGIDVIYKLNYILTIKQKRRALLVFICMLISSLLEMIGVSVIYPFLQAVMDESVLRKEWYSKWIYVINPDISQTSVMVFLCLIIIIVYLIKNAITLLCAYAQTRYSTSFSRELSTVMLESILKRPYEYFINNNSSVILQHIHGDVAATYNIIMNLFTFFSNLFTVGLIGIYLIYTDWQVAVAALLLAVFCFLFIVITFKKRLKNAGKESIIAAANQYKTSHQAIFGIKEISVMNRRTLFVNEFDIASRRVERINTIQTFLGACPDRILEGLCVGGFIGIVTVRIIMGGDPTSFIPVLGAFALGAFKILPSISKMSSAVNGIVFNQARMSNCYENKREAEYFEKTQRKISMPKDDEKGGLSFNDCIYIQNVEWRYEKSNVNVLENLNMKIKKGEAVALIGASGAGKTTLADVILGLLRPKKGSVCMDGMDIMAIPQTWSRTIGYVPQSVYLIDDTIRANIAFGLYGVKVDDKKVWDALEKAQLEEYVRNLPDQLDTIVGERGLKFSGGQRQRVAIARALYDDPDILVLDEATSALDTETETAVMESIEALLGEKTLIIIAHRLSTIRNCDRVFEIKNGTAIERSKVEVLENDVR